MYKLLVLAAVLAVASAHSVSYYAAAPVVHTPVVHTAAVPVVHHTAAAVPVATYSAGVVHRPVVYTSAVHHTVPVVHQTVPVVHTTGTKVVHTYKPVEQHGYKVVY